LELSLGFVSGLLKLLEFDLFIILRSKLLSK